MTQILRDQRYHYKECGLDYIYLANGFQITDGPGGKHVAITDIEGLHMAIGLHLAHQRRDITGKELRFLRQEMGMSQATLAVPLQVSEQRIHRWEQGKSEVSKPAAALVRLLYLEFLKPEVPEQQSIRALLKKISILEDESQLVMNNDDDSGWSQMKEAA